MLSTRNPEAFSRKGIHKPNALGMTSEKKTAERVKTRMEFYGVKLVRELR